MGPTVEPDATFFRVWAPAAAAVHVAGDFNEWSHDAHPLLPEPDGHWAGWVDGARAGHAYKLVLRAGDQELLRNDPYARAVTSSAGNSVLVAPRRDPGPAFALPPWNELVIYELHVGTFAAPSPDQPGTFRSAIERLDHLASLGVNAVELMPVAAFPGARSWGYNPCHPFAPESDYGGPAGLHALVDAAHQRGLGMLLDVVYNHFGPDDLDLWRFDGSFSDDGGGIYFYNDWRAQTPWGHTRPDYGCFEVRRYILDNARMWLDDYAFDGLRTDALAFVRNVHGGNDPEADLPDGWSLMQETNRLIRASAPGKITIAEDLSGHHLITASPDHGGQGFGAQWDARFVAVLRRQLTSPLDESRSMSELAEILVDRYNGDPFQRVIYSESHDAAANGHARVAEEISPGDPASPFARLRAALGLTLVFTAPGIPMLFQGQALHMGGAFSDAQPLDWSLADRHRGQVSLVRDLIRLRRNLDGHSRPLLGPHVSPLRVDDQHQLLFFLRSLDDQHVVVLMNFSAQLRSTPVGLPLPGRWSVRFNSASPGYWPDFADLPLLDLDASPGDGDGLPFVASLSLPPYAAVILSPADP